MPRISQKCAKTVPEISQKGAASNLAEICQKSQNVIGSEKIRLIAQKMKIEIFIPSCRAFQVQQNDD